jgi:hypothetical protein
MKARLKVWIPASPEPGMHFIVRKQAGTGVRIELEDFFHDVRAVGFKDDEGSTLLL